MSTWHKAGLNLQPSDMTIPDVEEMIEEVLENLADQECPGVERVLRFLAPEGYQVMVELCSENGRSKRRGASASSWNPDEDEIRIYFERVGEDGEAVEQPEPWNRASAPVRMRSGGRNAKTPTPRNWTPEPVALMAEEMDAAVEQLCGALGEAERGGHAFIALKWFRDAYLPRKMFAWTRHPEQRQMILAESIQRGRVTTGKIPNPKSPAFPTTTIQLHRSGLEVRAEAGGESAETQEEKTEA